MVYRVFSSSEDLLTLEIPNCSVFPAYYDQNDRLMYLTDEIIVCFKQGISPLERQQMESAYQLTPLQNNSRYSIYTCLDPFQTCVQLFETGQFVYCQPNFYHQLELAGHIPNDPYFNHQFYLQNTGQELNDGQFGNAGQDIKITDAWQLTTGHKSTRVMLFDNDGIALNHPDLPEYKIDRDPLFYTTITTGTTNTASYAHATACAGILAAEMDNNEGVTGISPRCTLMPVANYIDSWGTIQTFVDICANIELLEPHRRPSVVSCSVVALDSDAWKTAINSLSPLGVLFFFAAGNSAQHSATPPCDGIGFYSQVDSCANVVIVGATTAQGNAADYSGFGSWVDIAAPSATDIACPGGNCTYQPILPGQFPNIWTTDVEGSTGFNSSVNTAPATFNCTPSAQVALPLDNNNYTGRFYGTSAATPQVAAVAALMRSANSCIGYQEIIDILTSTADQTGSDPQGIPYNYNHDPSKPGHSEELGYGRLDAFEAVSAALALGGFDFEIEILNDICGMNDDGSISVHFPSGNANDYELFLEWPVYVGFDELPSVQINAEQPVTIQSHGPRPYILHVVNTATGCSSTRQFWIYRENTLELSTSVNLDCYPAQICAEVEGGQGPHTYFCNNQLGEAGIDLDQNTTLTLTVEDQEGCSISSDLAVEVPAFFEMMDDISTSSECHFIPHSSIQFSNPIAIEGALLEWNFGDGATATGQNVEHTYTTAGEFDLTLTITLPDCEPTLVEETVSIDSFDHRSNVTISNQSEANALLLNNSTFGSDIIFLANTTLYTLNDLTLYLSPSSDIIINEGASVRFNRCTLTSCSSWNGIDVRANSTLNPSQGSIIFDGASGSSFSIIEHARIGIETFDARTNANTTPISMLRAGYITCNRTLFRNNLSAVRLSNARMSVFMPNAGFNRCTFIVNDELQNHFVDTQGDYNLFRRHVSAERMLGYHFKGCSFVNAMTESTAVGEWRNRGVGIHASQSRFRIQELASTQVGVTHNGRFEGFDRGIATSKGISSLTITNQVFERNHIGVSLIGATGSRVFKNTFRIGERTNISFLDEQETYGTFPGNDFGLTNSNTTSYEGLVVYKGDIIEIAENVFEGITPTNGGISEDFFRVGVRVRATNTEDMAVRKNTLSKLDYANLANADNAGGTGTSGLRYICNVNSDNLQDFTNTDFVGSLGSATIGMVQMEPGGSNPGQAINQNWSAGNILSEDLDENEDTYIHFRNEGVGVEYWQGDDVLNLFADFVGIQEVNNNNGNPIPAHSCQPKYTTTVLPPHTPIMINGLIDSGLISKAEADEYLYIYLLLLDDGNTLALQQYVEDTWGSQVWATREQLLTISPYVTSTVLISVLDNTQVYPHAIAFELLMANPDIMKDPKLVTYLRTKSDPMPQYLIDLLLTHETGGTTRSLMEKELALKRTDHITKVSEALWAMMDYYEEDTYTETSIETVIGGIGTLNAEMATVEMMFNRGELMAATNRAETIPSRVHFSKGEKLEYEAYMNWITLRKDMIIANREWDSLNSNDRAALESMLLYFDTYAASQAMEVLNAFTETDYFVPPAFGQKGSLKQQMLTSSEINEQLIEVYPNPANYIVTFELKEFIPTVEMCTLIITDVMGREIHNQQVNPGLKQFLIEVADWPTGLYAFSIVAPNSLIQLNGKFDVVH